MFWATRVLRNCIFLRRNLQFWRRLYIPGPRGRRRKNLCKIARPRKRPSFLCFCCPRLRSFSSTDVHTRMYMEVFARFGQPCLTKSLEKQDQKDTARGSKNWKKFKGLNFFHFLAISSCFYLTFHLSCQTKAKSCFPQCFFFSCLRSRESECNHEPDWACCNFHCLAFSEGVESDEFGFFSRQEWTTFAADTIKFKYKEKKKQWTYLE